MLQLIAKLLQYALTFNERFEQQVMETSPHQIKKIDFWLFGKAVRINPIQVCSKDIPIIQN